MAISPDVPGIEVAVRCHGRALDEFEDPDAHDNDDVVAHPSVSKYIECVDDTEFDVSITIDSKYDWNYRNHIVCCNVYVDGEWIRGTAIRSSDFKLDGRAIHHHVKGKEVQDPITRLWSVRRFKFAAVKTIDDAQKERVACDLKVAKTLGTIKVVFTRAIEYGTGVYHTSHSNNAQSGAFELAEKSLKGKAVSHGTSYGRSETISCPTRVHIRDLEEDNGPILVLKFMYRSRDALKRELIIPRSPSHSPALEDLTPAERDRLARERLAELRKIKQEKKSTLIKREFGEVLDLTQDLPPPRPTKKSRLQDGKEVDVIDLTDD
ncbi:hypothetical protein F5Y07DRAFT_357424 [Xylaria sp. FL0933]|nr:hypothetical protein F5Y07DRAFT_357424 [Xylaria sp. FL0933]